MIDLTALGRRCKMEDDVGQAGEALQRRGPIEIGMQGPGAAFTPHGKLGRIAQHGNDLIALA